MWNGLHIKQCINIKFELLGYIWGRSIIICIDAGEHIDFRRIWRWEATNLIWRITANVKGNQRILVRGIN